jgi:tetratricopeptide (TPR) repeat protein
MNTPVSGDKLIRELSGLARCALGFGARMGSLLVMAVVILMATAEARAESQKPVKGTHVHITPPVGFEEADRFPGYMSRQTGSSVMVIEMPFPLTEISNSFSEVGWEKHGMTLLVKDPVVFGEHEGSILLVSQSIQGIEFLEWIGIFSDGKTTYLVNASFPRETASHLSDILKRTVVGARLTTTPSDPLDALPFSISPHDDMKIATVFGNSIVLSKGGVFPAKCMETPVMVIGASLCDALNIPDRRAFAEARLQKSEMLTAILPKATTPIAIDGLDGFETVADATDAESGAKALLYQVILFESGGYYLIQGIASEQEDNTQLLIFKQIANTFRRERAQALGNKEEATDKDKQVIDLSPESALASLSWGNALYDMGKKEEAIEKYKEAIQIDPKCALAYSNWGEALSAMGKKEEALEKYRQAVQIDPKSRNAYAGWGVTLGQLRRPEEAIGKFERATQLDPRYARGYHNWGIALYEMGKKEEAIDKYREAIRLDPSSAASYIQWGVALSVLGRKEEAVEKYMKAIEIDPKNAAAYYNWGNLLATLGKREEAMEKYREAIQIDPKDAGAYYNWGRCLSLLGRKEEAIEKYREAIQISPRNSRVYNSWGDALSALGRGEEAIEKCLKAIDIDPNYAIAYVTWGEALFVLGRNEEALEKLMKATEIDPNLVSAYRQWGQVLKSIGRLQEADEKFKMADVAEQRRRK